MNVDDIKEALRQVLREEFPRLASTYPQKSPLKKNSRPQPDFSTGQWIIPDELREEWRVQYPAADIDAVLAAAALEMDGRKKRPPRWTYDRWLRRRLRTAQAEAMRQAAARRAIEERAAPPCANAPGCAERSQVRIAIGGANLNFCIPCAEKERARQLSAGAANRPAPAAPAAPSSTQAETELARMRSLLGARASASSGPQHVGALIAAPRTPAQPEREPGCDDE